MISRSVDYALWIIDEAIARNIGGFICLDLGDCDQRLCVEVTGHQSWCGHPETLYRTLVKHIRSDMHLYIFFYHYQILYFTCRGYILIVEDAWRYLRQYSFLHPICYQLHREGAIHLGRKCNKRITKKTEASIACNCRGEAVSKKHNVMI